MPKVHVVQRGEEKERMSKEFIDTERMWSSMKRGRSTEIKKGRDREKRRIVQRRNHSRVDLGINLALNFLDDPINSMDFLDDSINSAHEP